MKYEWKPSMSVNENKIDSQHKRLLAQIAKLEKNIASRNVNMGVLRDTNHFLYTYFKEHFTYEEKYMGKIGFPKLEQHKKVHQSFIQFYDGFQRELMEKARARSLTSFDVKEMVVKIKKYLAEWLVDHLMKMDQEYARFAKRIK
ncbi:MAG: hemerythrin family protein [Nanoarchaeota archaeon]|nr:hemerythrin family protein [Nanoarchaeota archaeon]